MQHLAVGDYVKYVGGGRFCGSQVFAGLYELHVGATGRVQAIPGQHGDLSCAFGDLKVSLNGADVRAVHNGQAIDTPALRLERTPQKREMIPRSTSTSRAPRAFQNQSLARTSERANLLSGAVPKSAARANSLGALRLIHKKSIVGAAEEGQSESSGDSARDQRPHPPSFYCPISHQCMHDPVMLSDGHTYERRHIEQWLQNNDTSPVSGAKLLQLAVFPNHALRNAIEEYFEQILGGHRQAIKQAVAGLENNFSSNTKLLCTIDSLMQCSILVNADLSIERVLTKIMDEAKSLVGAEAASVFLVDRKRRELFSTVNSTGSELRIPIKSGIAGAVAYSGMPLIVQNAYSDKRFNTEVDHRTGFKTRSILCVPIRAWKGGIIGVAQLINKSKGGVIARSPLERFERKVGKAEELVFTADDQQFFEVLAGQAGAAIVNSGMFESIRGVRGAGRWPSPTKCRSPELDVDDHDNQEQLELHTSLSSGSVDVPVLAQKEPSSSQCQAHGTSPDEVSEKSFAPSSKELRLAKPLLVCAAKSWETDTLCLAELSGNRPLSILAMHLFVHHELVDFFGMEHSKLERFLFEIENGYPVKNQYHNRAHAASVLHFMHALLSLGGLAEVAGKAMGNTPGTRQQKLLILACLLAAIVHDFEHDGVNNDFLVKSQSVRAIRYNDKSPNENHHVAAAWSVLLRPECNFVECFSEDEVQQVRKLVISLVLSTDMAEHGGTLNKFKNFVASFDSDELLEAGPATSQKVMPTSQEEAVLILHMALKCADLGHLALCWNSHMRWVQRLESEFFAQGDNEIKLGMPSVSFLMDRKKPGASDTQVGFFDFVVLPLYRAFTNAFPSASPMLQGVEANYAKWQEVQVEAQQDK